MKPAWQAGLAVAGLAALLSAGYLLQPRAAAPVQRYQCTDLTQPCLVELAGQRYQLQAASAPSALRPFRLSLRGTTPPDTLRVHFGMQGMEMGPIAFPLPKQADGSAAASIVLPYCVQGRRDWWLRLESADAAIEVAFQAAG